SDVCSSDLNYGIINGLSGIPIPDNYRFPLIGDPDSGYIRSVNPLFSSGLGGRTNLGRPNFQGIVLNPTRFRKILCKFFLGYRNNVALFIKNNGTGTRCTLV